MPTREKVDPVDSVRDGNRLIDGLPPRQRHEVLAQCGLTELAAGTVLCEVGEPFEYAYFPLSGSISLTSEFLDHQSFETESIGDEGMVGANLILDVNRSFQRGIVLTPCLALRIKTRRLRVALQRNPALFHILRRYLYVVLSERLQTTKPYQLS